MNYVCNRVGSGRISWEVWCLSSSSETCCSDSYTESGGQTVAREDTTTINLCGRDASRNMHFNATLHNQLDVSNLTITALQPTTTKLRIVCEGMNLDCQYLQVAGEMS